MAQTRSGALDSRALDVGQAISDGAEALRRNWGSYLLLSIVFVGLTSAVSTWGVEQLVARQVLSRANVGASFLIGFARTFPVSITSCVVQAAVMRGTADFFSDGRRSLGEVLTTALGCWIPLLALQLMRAAAVDLAYLALIVPGVMLSVAWWVAAPVLVIEKASPIASLLRSAELTRGNRWSIFGLAIVVGIFGLIIGFVAGLIGGFVFGFLKAFGIHGFSAQMLAYPISFTLSVPLGSAIVAAAYRQLSGGGGEAETLAQVFA